MTLIHIQNKVKPSTILFSFDRVLKEGLISVNWAVAYATKSGCEDLIQTIVNKVGTDVWARCSKEFVISIDFGHTEPGALELLRGLENSSVSIANPDLLARGHLRPNTAYHPKLYCFQYENEIGMVSGSANLTKAALHKNTELVNSLLIEKSEINFNELWTDVQSGSVILTDELLDRYKYLRRLAKSAFIPRAEPIDDLDVIATPYQEAEDSLYTPDSTELLQSHDDTSGVPWLWGAISTGTNPVNPMDYDHFWVNAGSMSSSASHNQLELGRGSNIFFGYNYRNFISEGSVITLGQIRVKINHEMYEDASRIYKWHPNNMMERVNLPTYRMANVEYQHKCLLFKRKDGYFELIIADWDSEEAISWRSASTKINRRYSIATNNRSSRNCGFF